jgi:glyoxylase-like metal-dependent hydrolase (beta-lactamase superfamily II)
MNAYALICPTTGQSVLIDPGAEPDSLQEILVGSSPEAILLTHSHEDHIQALSEMRLRLKQPVMAFVAPQGQRPDFEVDRQLESDDIVQVGDHALRVYHAPGHIDDQICFYLVGDHRAVVGDTIFEGGPGKTWSNAGFQQTLITLRDVILPWPDETICYPGHGPSFVLGEKRAAINRFLARDQGDFYGDAEWDM